MMVHTTKTATPHYQDRLVDMIVDVIHNETTWWKRPEGPAISEALNQVAIDLKLSIRLYFTLKKGQVISVKVDYDNNVDESLMYPELIARFKERYSQMI